MKKTFFFIIASLLLISCESKYEKTVKALESNIWITDYQKDYNSPDQNIKKFEGKDIKIHQFTDNSIYIYDAEGNPETIFSYKKVNDKGTLKITVENLFSYNKEQYTVIANDFMLDLLGGKEGEFNQVNFNLLTDEKIKKKIIDTLSH